MAEDHSSVNYAQLVLRSLCALNALLLWFLSGSSWDGILGVRTNGARFAIPMGQCPGVRKSVASISHRIYIYKKSRGLNGETVWAALFQKRRGSKYRSTTNFKILHYYNGDKSMRFTYFSVIPFQFFPHVTFQITIAIVMRWIKNANILKIKKKHVFAPSI